MTNERWYALMTSAEDNDWGTGTFDYDEAVKKVKESDGYYTMIAVIENDVCVEEIYADEM